MPYYNLTNYSTTVDLLQFTQTSNNLLGKGTLGDLILIAFFFVLWAGLKHFTEWRAHLAASIITLMVSIFMSAWGITSWLIVTLAAINTLLAIPFSFKKTD